MAQDQVGFDAPRPRSWRRRAVAGAAVAAVAFVSTLVLAEWLASGTGEGYARAGSAEPLSTQSAVAGASLYPGGTGDLVLRVVNPNPFTVTLTSVQPNGTITSDAPACDAGGHGVTFDGYTGNHVLAASSVTELVLPDVLAMASTSATECQDATFTIPVSLNGGSGGTTTTSSTTSTTIECNDNDPNTLDAVDEFGLCTFIPINGQPWYADADSDGFGDANAVVNVVVPPAGYVDNDDDCDDTDSSVNPDAQEVADPNNADEDCDGLADDDDPSVTGKTVWYRDADLDSYGTDADVLLRADGPLGYSDVGGDCDDADDEAFPGATEIVDGKDNDCDAAIDEGVL